MCQHCRTIQLILSILAPEFSVPWNSWDPKLLRSVSVFFCTAFSSRICEVMSKIAPWWKQEIPTHQKSHHEWGKNWCFFPKVLLMFLAPSEICLPSRTTGTPRSKMSKAHQGGAGWGHTCPERQPPRAPQGDCQDHPPNGGFLVHPISSTTSSLVWDYMGLYGIIYG